MTSTDFITTTLSDRLDDWQDAFARIQQSGQLRIPHVPRGPHHAPPCPALGIRARIDNHPAGRGLAAVARPEPRRHLARTPACSRSGPRADRNSAGSAPTSAPAIQRPSSSAGKVYLQTTKDKEEFALCLDEKTGKEVWTARIGEMYEIPGNAWPGTRSSPTVDGDRIYCLSSKGQLVCFGIDDAKEKWKKDFIKDLGGVVG